MALGQSFAFPRHTKATPHAAPVFVYIGTDTAGGVSKGIYVCGFTPATGELGPPRLVAATPRPAYLAVSPLIKGHHRLYATNETAEPNGSVSSYLQNPLTGDLTPINQVSAQSPGPTYIALDATGEAAFVANYAGSSIVTYHVLPDGALSPPVQQVDFTDPKFSARSENMRHGVNAARQGSPHPHSTHLSPDNRFLLVSDLGSDRISVFPVDAAAATLGTPAMFSNDRPGSGPRHIAFHPNGRWVYSINELDSTIDHFLWTTTSSRSAPQGLLINAGKPVKTCDPALPSEKNTAAEIALSPDGRFLYASNRGEDTLVVFAVAPGDGALALLQRIPCGGRTPRQFTLSPDLEARWLLCGNQNSASVTVFHRDPVTGRLSGPNQTLAIDSPMVIVFA